MIVRVNVVMNKTIGDSDCQLVTTTNNSPIQAYAYPL